MLASFNTAIKLFADDVKLYVKVTGPVDESELQNALTVLVSCANSRQLSVTIDKFCVLNIGQQVIPSQFLERDLHLPRPLNTRKMTLLGKHMNVKST